MENQHLPSINSFVIRFVYEAADAAPEIPGAAHPPGESLSPGEYASPGESPQPSYRGTIRHIPTGEEVVFTRWADAVEFIQRFVPLDSNER